MTGVGKKVEKESDELDDFVEQYNFDPFFTGNPFRLKFDTKPFGTAFLSKQQELIKELTKGNKASNFFFAALIELKKLSQKDEEAKKALTYYHEKLVALSLLNPELAAHPAILQLQRESQADSEKQNILSKFILNPDEVYRRVVFPCCNISGNGMAYGLFLPANGEIRKKDQVVALTQVEKPVLISDQHTIYEVTPHFSNHHRLKFEAEPVPIPLRWSLGSIKKYLQEKTEPADPAELFNRIRSQYKKYIYFYDDRWYDVHAIWDMGTYLHQLFQAYPLMELRGMSGTGKSTIMRVSNFISFNALPIMNNPSEATLFRETHNKRPTKYIDEAEKLFMVGKGGKIEADPRVELINSSYEAGAAVGRQVKIGDNYTTAYFQTYSPTMLGSINGLKGATEDRAIVHITTRAPSTDRRSRQDPEKDKADTAWQDIRDSLYLWGLGSWREVLQEYNSEELERKSGLSNRDLKIWKSLLAIAKHIRPEVFASVSAFALRLTDLKQNDTVGEGTLNFKLLEVLTKMLTDVPQRVHVVDIRTKYLYETGEQNIAPKTIAMRLDELGLREFRGRDAKGNYFEVSRKLVQTIIEPVLPGFLTKNATFATFATDSSLEDKEKEERIDVENVNNNVANVANSLVVAQSCVANDGNEANVDVETHGGLSKEALLDAILRLDRGQGAPFEQLWDRFKDKAWLELALGEVRLRGQAWECRPGFWKVLQ